MGDSRSFGKLKTERMVPIDSFVCRVVHRLRFFRSFDPLPFDGRLLAEASPGPGERIVVAPIDITALRHERETRRGHTMLSHLRTEAYPVYRAHRYPP